MVEKKGSPRIRGNKLPVFTLGTPGTDQAVDLISWKITNDEADTDVTTFEDAAAGGGRLFKLAGEAIQSTAAASFWRYNWENAGLADVPYTIAPHGNAVPTESEPHLVGTLTIGPKPEIGSEADKSKSSASTFEFEYEIDGVPTLDTGA